MSDTNKPDSINYQHADYLDDLRESGETNMFGAAPLLREEFGMSIEHAREIVAIWMRTFADRKGKG